MTHRVTVLPGDGIGPELVAATRRVLDASGAELSWEEHQIGVAAVAAGLDPLPDTVVESVRRNGVALKGPASTPPGMRSVNVGLRRALDLYLQVRPSRTRPGVASRYADVALEVVRETTEDLYAGIEFAPDELETRQLLGWLAEHGVDLPAGTGLSLKPTSYAAAYRAARAAARHAVATGARRLTVVHKATVMRATDGVFLQAARDATREHAPDLPVDDLSVDAAAAALVRRPETFGVLVMPNLYGDVLSDLSAALVGGVGLAPGANLGDGVAVFEAAHGTAPRHAGRGTANPLGVLLSGVLMLRHVGETEAADRVERAVDRVLADGSQLTQDLRPPGDARPAATTEGLADAVLAALDDER